MFGSDPDSVLMVKISLGSLAPFLDTARRYIWYHFPDSKLISSYSFLLDSIVDGEEKGDEDGDSAIELSSTEAGKEISNQGDFSSL